jgi:hypothetical protein
VPSLSFTAASIFNLDFLPDAKVQNEKRALAFILPPRLSILQCLSHGKVEGRRKCSDFLYCRLALQMQYLSNKSIEKQKEGLTFYSAALLYKCSVFPMRVSKSRKRLSLSFLPLRFASAAA